jgi:type IV pilus assembly protein PilV
MSTHSLASNSLAIANMQTAKHQNPKRLNMQRLNIKRYQGATMIEILIAVLILSFGLLGMAALQTRAIQGNQSSLQRSQAIMLAYSMMDMMRIDRVQAAASAYNMNKVTAGGFSSDGTLAKNNQISWLQAMAANLAGGVASTPAYGTISCNSAFFCTVTIEWDDSRSGGMPEQKVTVQGTI